MRKSTSTEEPEKMVFRQGCGQDGELVPAAEHPVKPASEEVATEEASKDGEG